MDQWQSDILRGGKREMRSYTSLQIFLPFFLVVFVGGSSAANIASSNTFFNPEINNLLKKL